MTGCLHIPQKGVLLEPSQLVQAQMPFVCVQLVPAGELTGGYPYQKN